MVLGNWLLVALLEPLEGGATQDLQRSLPISVLFCGSLDCQAHGVLITGKVWGGGELIGIYMGAGTGSNTVHPLH